MLKNYLFSRENERLTRPCSPIVKNMLLSLDRLTRCNNEIRKHILIGFPFCESHDQVLGIYHETATDSHFLIIYSLCIPKVILKIESSYPLFLSSYRNNQQEDYFGHNNLPSLIRVIQCCDGEVFVVVKETKNDDDLNSFEFNVSILPCFKRKGSYRGVHFSLFLMEKVSFLSRDLIKLDDGGYVLALNQIDCILFVHFNVVSSDCKGEGKEMEWNNGINDEKENDWIPFLFNVNECPFDIIFDDEVKEGICTSIKFSENLLKFDVEVFLSLLQRGGKFDSFVEGAQNCSLKDYYVQIFSSSQECCLLFLGVELVSKLKNVYKLLISVFIDITFKTKPRWIILKPSTFFGTEEECFTENSLQELVFKAFRKFSSADIHLLRNNSSASCCHKNIKGNYVFDTKAFLSGSSLKALKHPCLPLVITK